LTTSTDLADPAAIEKALGVELVVEIKSPGIALKGDRPPVVNYDFRLVGAPSYISAPMSYGYAEDADGKKRDISLIILYDGRKACLSVRSFNERVPDFRSPDGRPPIDHPWMFDGGALVGNLLGASHQAIATALFKGNCLSQFAISERRHD
jgi:hypothetical protein